MFTGLIETTGQVVATLDKPPARTLCVEIGEQLRSDLALGDSISINGCCLTVVKIDERGVDFEAGEET
ncbi:MAG: riboflavin synthase, partial [Planctomycetaceae bacterium]